MGERMYTPYTAGNKTAACPGTLTSGLCGELNVYTSVCRNNPSKPLYFQDEQQQRYCCHFKWREGQLQDKSAAFTYTCTCTLTEAVFTANEI